MAAGTCGRGMLGLGVYGESSKALVLVSCAPAPSPAGVACIVAVFQVLRTPGHQLGGALWRSVSGLAVLQNMVWFGARLHATRSCGQLRPGLLCEFHQGHLGAQWAPQTVYIHIRLVRPDSS